MQAYERLEYEFGRWAGVDNVVVSSSGTAALHLAFESLSLPLGSQVILCDFNMVACARAVTLAGLRPVFVDCDDRLLIDPEKVEEYMQNDWGTKDPPQVSAILCTHIYGRACDMSAIHDIAGKYDLKVIEDLAEAHGVPPHPNTHASCYSFYKNKIIAGEEGGAVAFKDEQHAKKAKSLRSLGFTDAHDYTHIPRGHNYRLANCLASRVLEGMDRYSRLRYSEMRRMIERWYNEYCPTEWQMPERDAVWVYDLRIPGMSDFEQTQVVEVLRYKGIEARNSFKPMTTLEEYYQKPKVVDTKASRASHEIIYLPVQPGITTKADCKRAIDVIREVLGY